MAIEFSRNITFGQYLDLRSPIHRLDPRTKIVAFGMLMIATLLARNFLAIGVLFAGAALIQIVARIPISYTLRGMRLLVITLLVFFVFQVLFHPNPAPETTWWRWGIVSVSLDGISLASLTLLRVVMLYFLSSTLMFTTSMMDLADGLEVLLDPLKRIHVPINELVMTMVIALKFVPLLVAELERLLKAQAARGASVDSGRLVGRARSLGAVLVPIFVNAFTRAEVLTTAMNARCYRGGQGRTKRRLLRFGRADAVGLVVALVIAAASVAAGRAVGV